MPPRNFFLSPLSLSCRRYSDGTGFDQNFGAQCSGACDKLGNVVDLEPSCSFISISSLLNISTNTHLHGHYSGIFIAMVIFSPGHLLSCLLELFCSFTFQAKALADPSSYDKYIEQRRQEKLEKEFANRITVSYIRFEFSVLLFFLCQLFCTVIVILGGRLNLWYLLLQPSITFFIIPYCINLFLFLKCIYLFRYTNICINWCLHMPPRKLVDPIMPG